MTVNELLSQIDLGSLALPEFQRGYVWNRDQVRALMQSLYRSYPVGGLLVWKTRTESATGRGEQVLQAGYVDLLLDGQQRITTLYGIVRGRAPKFFDGNEQTFTGLYFNVETEAFEFFMKQKMSGDPTWINVTELMEKGIVSFIQPFMAHERVQTYMERLNRLHRIRETDFHLETVTGEDKTVDIVVDIFNRLNSGGTKLSKGDLALARICAAWPEARTEMKARLKKWERAGYYFKLDWFLRCITAIVTGRAVFDSLEKITTAEFASGLVRAEKAVDYILNLFAGRLGIDHDRVLGAPYTIPLLARYVDRRGGVISDAKERDRLLYWYIHAFLWGRYSGSTESVLSQDLGFIEEMEGGLERLIGALRQQRGDLTLHPQDFLGWSTGARFYPLLHMLSRVGSSMDWQSGLSLKGNLLGGSNRLHVHHIFPKSRLKDFGYPRPLRNTLANYTFLTAGTNINISNDEPASYLAEIADKFPGALESHWIPMDRELWRMDNYEHFLTARRELLAAAANDFLNQLTAGPAQETLPVNIAAWESSPFASEDEELEVDEANVWVLQQGLPRGDKAFELAEANGGRIVAILDLAWPSGMQEGLSDSVALMIDEEDAAIAAASACGFRVFTSVEALKRYVESEVLALTPA